MPLSLPPLNVGTKALAVSSVYIIPMKSGIDITSIFLLLLPFPTTTKQKKTRFLEETGFLNTLKALGLIKL